MRRFCHKCPLNSLSSTECLSCQLEEEYYFKNPHVFDTYDPPQPEPTIPERVTSLPEDIEDQLRIAICNLFSLKPIELLCLQAIIRKQSLTEFADSLTKLVNKIHSQIQKSQEKKITRFHAFQIRKAILSKLPRFRDVLLTKGQRRPLK